MRLYGANKHNRRKCGQHNITGNTQIMNKICNEAEGRLDRYNVKGGRDGANKSIETQEQTKTISWTQATKLKSFMSGPSLSLSHYQ